jgi:ATP-dependent DNA helicase RecG
MGGDHTMTPTMTETETVELKKSLAELKQGLISLAAMLNKHDQAELWFGVAPDGTAVGLHLNEKTLRDVSQAIAAHIEPRIYPEITRQHLAGKSCLHVCANGQQKPYFAYGRAYIRVADEDRQMSARELEALILEQNRTALRWDNEPANISPRVLNESKIRRFLEAASLPWDNAPNALQKLGLLHDGQPVNAARLFFADAPIQLRCAVFATHTSATIIDRHDFDGDILELIEEAEKYILKNIHIGMKLDGLRRVDVAEISPEALREAVINAFCHRDWRDPDYIQIAIYKDRVEIRNPGGLYDGLTLEDLRRGNISRRRNPLIADLLRRIHLVEAWGRGMPLILENAPDVTFSTVAGLFIASFKRPTALETPNTTLETPETTTTPETPETRPKTRLETDLEHQENTKKTPRKHQENTWKILLQHLRQQPESSVRSLAETLGMSEASVRHHLRRLQAENKIRRIGPDKGGYWEVIRDVAE